MTYIADLVLKGGTIITEHSRIAASVAVSGGRIVAIGMPESLPRAHEEIDVTGLYLLPGAVDVQVHFREPGLEYKEDWRTGTESAAAGGVTTVFDMHVSTDLLAEVGHFIDERDLHREEGVGRVLRQLGGFYDPVAMRQAGFDYHDVGRAEGPQ